MVFLDKQQHKQRAAGGEETGIKILNQDCLLAVFCMSALQKLHELRSGQCFKEHTNTPQEWGAPNTNMKDHRSAFFWLKCSWCGKYWATLPWASAWHALALQQRLPRGAAGCSPAARPGIAPLLAHRHSRETWNTGNPETWNTGNPAWHCTVRACSHSRGLRRKSPLSRD